MLSVTASISSAASMVDVPLASHCRAMASASVAMISMNPAMRARWKAGCNKRRWFSHDGPSLVSRPLPSRC